MKKRIIAAIVAIVTVLLSLASCGMSFNFAEEDINEFVSFDINAFKEALAKIEIEDGDFTTDEDVRKEKVVEDLYASLTAAMIKAAGDEDKLTSGIPSKNDVIYFCYYCVDADGNVFYTSQMKDSTVTASSTKANHVIQLADFDEDKELQAAMAEAFLAAIEAGREVSKYEIAATKGTAVNTKTDAEKELTPDTIMVSYKVSYELPATNEDGSLKLDEQGEQVYDTYNKVVGFEKLDLSADTPLAAYLRGDKITMTVGNSTYITEGEGEGAKKVYSHKVTETVGEHTDVVCTYTELTPQWIIKEEPAEAYITVKHTPYSSVNKVEPDNRHNTGDKIDLNDKELTYYVYPVNYIAVPELSATSIMKDILGTNLAVSTIDIFGSEEYKNGDQTVKAMVETLVKLWDEDADTLKSFTVEGDKTLATLKDEYKTAADAVKAAGDKATTEQKDKETATKKAYETAREAKIDEQNAKILAATSTAEGAKAMADVVVEEYKVVIYDKLKDAYDNDIIEKVGSEVWKLVDKYGTVKAYPEKLVEDFVDHLYEGYENDFYTGKKDSSTSSTAVSNYEHYKGDLDAFLKDKVGNDIDAGLAKEAKAAIDPMLKIYAAAKALESDAVAALPGYVDADIAAGVYDAEYEDDDKLTDKQNDKKRAEAEEAAEEAKAEAKEDATKFLITDKVFKEFKKELGKATYRVWEEQYGEMNIRLSLQCNRLFYYLLATDIEKDDEGENQVKYVTVGEGENETKVLSFRTFTYTIKAEEAKD